MKYGLELSLISSVLGYFICKLFSLPPIYAILYPAFIGLSWWNTKRTLWLKPLLIPVVGISFLLATTGTLYERWPMAAAFCLMPVMMILFAQIVEGPDFTLDRLPIIFLGMAAAFALLIIYGVGMRWDELTEKIDIFFTLDHWTRKNSDLRYYMVSILSPRSGDVIEATFLRTFIELLAAWVSMFFFTRHGLKNRYLVGSFCISFGYCLIASSRGAVILAGFFILAMMLDQLPRLRKLAICAVVPIPLILAFVNSPVFSGRSQMYQGGLKGLSLFGNGLGSSSVLAEMLSEGERNQIHNIFLEISYDWGLLFYVLLTVFAVAYLLKRGYFRIAVVVFVVGSLGYTVYGPWFTWTIFFAWLIDRRQNRTVIN